MKHDEHDELWELLGKAREPKDSPFFASKVLRAIRAEAQEPKGLTFWQWLRRSWLLPSLATATAAVAIFVALQDSPTPVTRTSSDSSIAESGTKTGSNDPVVVVKADPLSGLAEAMSAMSADDDDLSTPLPELLATEDHSVWLQDDLSSLY